MKSVAKGALFAPDRAGMVASTLCAVHCLANAFLPTAIAALGLAEVLGHEIEGLLTLVAVVLAAFSLWGGYRMHGDAPVAGVMGLGIGGLMSARVIESTPYHDLGMWIGVSAGLILVVGHVMNRRASRRSLGLV